MATWETSPSLTNLPLCRVCDADLTEYKLPVCNNNNMPILKWDLCPVCQTDLYNCAKENAVDNYYKCTYNCGAKVPLTNDKHLMNCLNAPVRVCCLIEQEEVNEYCTWQGSPEALIHHVNAEHTQELIVLTELIDFQIVLDTNFKTKLLLLYNPSYIKNEIYWLRKYIEDSQQMFIVEHLASTAGPIYGESITIKSFRVDFDSDHKSCLKKLVVVNSSKVKKINNYCVNITNNVFQKKHISIYFTHKPGISKDLLPLLECPICKIFMDSRIMNCSAGHSVCSTCCDRLEKCPFCQSNFTAGRNFPLEDICKKFNNACKYRRQGCMDELGLMDLEDHETTCWFQPVTCPSCSWAGTHCSFLDHLSNSECMRVTENLDISVLDKTFSNSMCYKYDVYHNIFIVKFLKNEENLDIIVYQVTTDNSKAFNYELKFFDCNSEIGLAYYGKCVVEFENTAPKNKKRILCDNDYEKFSFDAHYKIND